MMVSSDGEYAELMEAVRMLDGLDGEGLRLSGSMRTMRTG